jgi:hypothetical protein
MKRSLLLAAFLCGCMAAPAQALNTVGISLDLSRQSLKPLKSGWEWYFGKNYGSAPAYNKALGMTIREYDGPNVMFPAGFSVANGYSRDNVLHNFRNWRRADAQGLDTNAAEIVAEGMDVIYGATLLKPDGTLDAALSYALLDSIYGYRKELLGRVYIQWGNEINGKHLGLPQANVNELLGVIETVPGKVDWSQYNRPEDQRPFVENYFLPVVSLTREVSAKLFNDPAAIKIMSPSFANIFNPAFRQWMYGILDFPVDATRFPNLGVQQTSGTIDILTVHYPFARPDGTAVMQEIWDRYGATNKIKGLWVTEDYGRDTSGPAGLIDRGMRYFSWVAANGLDANQTRLCWWGIEAEYPGGKPVDAAIAMGDWLSGRPLRYRQFSVNGETIDAIYAEDALHPRYLLVLRAAPRSAHYRIALTGAGIAAGGTARATLYSVTAKPAALAPLLSKTADTLDIDFDVIGDGPLLLLIGD